jgi:hypothetical protein
MLALGRLYSGLGSVKLKSSNKFSLEASEAIHFRNQSLYRPVILPMITS